MGKTIRGARCSTLIARYRINKPQPVRAHIRVRDLSHATAQ
ncbi:hypothetical protein [Lysobacter gummosus]